MSALLKILRDGPGVRWTALGISRLPGDRETRLSRLDIDEVVLDTLARLDGELRNRRIVVATALGSGLPTVRADKAQIQQALSSLIENAIEAMDGIASRPRLLRIRTEGYSRGILVTIEDNGRGLDPRASERVFDPSYTTKAKQVGLGLAICRSIVAAHGGRVWARPGDSYGAVLQLMLPAADPAT